MKTLVIYYSRDGHTKTVANEISANLKADIEEIKETKSRSGVIGWLKAGKDATMKKVTEIESPKIDPSIYDLVLICTPIWAFTMAPGIRAWLAQYGKNLKKVAFLATMGGSGDKRAFNHMEELCGKAPIATVTLIDKKVAKGEYKTLLDDFIKKLNAA